MQKQRNDDYRSKEGDLKKKREKKEEERKRNKRLILKKKALVLTYWEVETNS